MPLGDSGKAVGAKFWRVVSRVGRLGRTAAALLYCFCANLGHGAWVR
jgi:hypothetical protein